MLASQLAVGILAGGAGTRLGGREKGLIEVGGQSILSRLLDRLEVIYLEIVISTNRPELYAWTEWPCVPDQLPTPSPLAGLHAILSSVRWSKRVFVIGCDMPGASPVLAETLAEREADVVLPVSPAGDEPLHAVYSTNCLPAIERAAAAGRWKMTDFLADVHTVRVSVDPAEWTRGLLPPFFNLNTPDDLAVLERVYHRDGS